MDNPITVVLIDLLQEIVWFTNTFRIQSVAYYWVILPFYLLSGAPTMYSCSNRFSVLSVYFNTSRHAENTFSRQSKKPCTTGIWPTFQLVELKSGRKDEMQYICNWAYCLAIHLKTPGLDQTHLKMGDWFPQKKEQIYLIPKSDSMYVAGKTNVALGGLGIMHNNTIVRSLLQISKAIL